jgi:hypothetical protein
VSEIPIEPGAGRNGSAVGRTYQAGTAGGHSFFRTNTATEVAAYTCRATQVSQGTYDRVTNRTYITYTGGLDGTDPDGRPFTAENPTIMAFDHNSYTWEGPVQIYNVRGLPGAARDCHNYPQVLIDSTGHLHVFHTLHFSGINIQHFVSQKPHDISGPWVRKEIPATERNTYGAAFKNNSGHFYVFYRATIWRYVDPPPDARGLWYEPEMYVKSIDEGQTWSVPHLLIDPGRPTASDGTEAARVTSLINDGGWNTIYVADWAQDQARNRLLFDFTSTFEHGQQWGNRIIVYFDMGKDVVRAMTGKDFGPTIDRDEYLANENEGIRVYTTRLVTKYMDRYGHGLSQSIVIEDEVNGHPTVYYVKFESTNPEAGPDHVDYYRTGWDRLRRAQWNGRAWDDTYVGGTADPNADPFIQWDPLTQRRRETASIWDAEYRKDEGTFLYVKTRWGGTNFWLDGDGFRKPEFDWANCAWDYQYPGRIFNAKWGWGTSVRMFGDHHEWEVRGISNFTLIPGGHPSIRALMRMPKYTALTPTTGGASRGWLEQYAIGADYVWGERPPLVASPAPGPEKE